MFSLAPDRVLRSFIVSIVLAATLTACSDEAGQWNGTKVTGDLPDLAFTMTRAGDGATVSAEDFRGKVSLLFFGYTFCPDICPLTLTNLSQVLADLGDRADQVRVLFVSVDPDRDTLDVLKKYTAAFAPQMVGLRGTDDQIAALAKRYRVAYSVTPEDENGAYVVTHSPTVYAFDKDGEARLLYTELDTGDSDTTGVVADLQRLIGEQETGGLLSWF